MRKSIIKCRIWNSTGFKLRIPYPQFIGLLIVIIFIVSGKSTSEKNYITVKTVVGKVTALSPDSMMVRRLRIGTRVMYGWNIRTEMEASADLVFNSGAIVHIAENSVVTISEKLERNSDLIYTPIK